MTNLVSLLKNVDDIKISKKERKYLLQEANRTLGNERQLTIAIEEIAELINVLSLDIIDEFDYLHTVEEVVDVLIAMRTIELIEGIQLPKKTELDVGKKKMKVLTYYSQLSKAQQYISKYIRHGVIAKDKLVQALGLLDSSTKGIIAMCNIKKKDIINIETLKYKRLQDRLKSKELK